MRWVITTILFSEKKVQYIETILTLSPQTRYFLQCTIETVMAVFPQDEVNQSTLSDIQSALEDSFSEVCPRQGSLNSSHVELRHHFEGLFFYSISV